MPGICYNPYGCEWTVAQIWRSLDCIVRTDVIVLAWMLAYTIFVVCRFAVFHRSAKARSRHVLHIAGNEHPKHLDKTIIAIYNIKSIATVAPMLGEVGTCFGILEAFSGIGMEKHAALAMMSSRVALALVPSAVGIVVSIVAVCTYNYLHGWIESIDISPRAKYGRIKKPQLSSVKRLSELPGFALMAGVVLIISALAFTMNAFPYGSVGLRLHLLRKEALQKRTHMVITVARSTRYNSVSVFVGGNRISVDHMNEMSTILLRTSPGTLTYLTAEDDVPWTDVTDVIDTLHGLDVVLKKQAARNGP